MVETDARTAPTRTPYAHPYVKIKGVWHERVPYAPPERHAPLRMAVRMDVEVERAARTGRVKAVRALLDGEPYALPGPARTMLKTLVSAGARTEDDGAYHAFVALVTYARGYALDADGEMQRKIIWATQDPSDEDARTRYKVGLEDPQPVDSILVRAIWRTEDARITRAIGAYWTDGTYDNACEWTRGAYRTLTNAELKAALKGLTEGE